MPLGRRTVDVQTVAAAFLADRLRDLGVFVRRETALGEWVAVAGKCVDRHQRKGGQGCCREESFSVDRGHVSDTKKPGETTS